jgi:NADH:ubiquinone oxidoreductase subunit
MNTGVATNRVNLVWTDRGIEEINWLRHLLGPMILREVVAEKFDFVEQDSVYVVSANQNLCSRFPTAFLAAIGKVRGKGLIHVGDEYFAGGYDVYKKFDFVLRTHHTAIFDGVPEVLTIPLGWAEGMPQRSDLKPVETRKYIWSFLGNQKASSRPEMLRALRQIEPQYVHTYTAGVAGAKRVSRPEYHALLDDTVFAPCPMGNAMLETWRFYEALEAGCIPIIEARPWMHYHKRLLGPHPIPTIYRWSQATSLVIALSADPAQLKVLQQRIASWWVQYKQSNQVTIHRFISEKIVGHDGKLSTRRLPSTSPFWPMRQMVELLRHQSPMSLFRRAKRPFARLASKR